jgi:hypothetical protein
MIKPYQSSGKSNTIFYEKGNWFVPAASTPSRGMSAESSATLLHPYSRGLQMYHYEASELTLILSMSIISYYAFALQYFNSRICIIHVLAWRPTLASALTMQGGRLASRYEPLILALTSRSIRRPLSTCSCLPALDTEPTLEIQRRFPSERFVSPNPDLVGVDRVNVISAAIWNQVTSPR